MSTQKLPPRCRSNAVYAGPTNLYAMCVLPRRLTAVASVAGIADSVTLALFAVNVAARKVSAFHVSASQQQHQER
jgi:hypothetical protein